MCGFMLSCPMFDDISQMKLEIANVLGGWFAFLSRCARRRTCEALAESYHKMATVPTGRSRHIKGLVKLNPATMVTKQTPYSYIGPLV
jgi:hypothetical protein